MKPCLALSRAGASLVGVEEIASPIVPTRDPVRSSPWEAGNDVAWPMRACKRRLRTRGVCIRLRVFVVHRTSPGPFVKPVVAWPVARVWWPGGWSRGLVGLGHMRD